MSSAILGYGTLLQLSDEASAPDTIFTSVAEITNVAISGNDRDTIDVTHHESLAAAREFIAGCLGGATIQLSLNFLPAHATHEDLTDNLHETTAADIFRTYRIVWPDFGKLPLTGTVNTGTEIWTTATHPWLTGQPVRFTTSGALPASTPQIVVGQTYYLKVIDDETFTVHVNSADAAADTNAINFTGAGTGTHTVNGGTSWTFQAHVSGFESAAKFDDKLTASPSFKITGSIAIEPEEA
jgi:predicted secreted protein